jgi:ATP-dependent Clp protease ATP-binding subunit ClpA
LESIEPLPEETEYIPEASVQLSKVIELAVQQVVSSSAEAIDIPHLTRAILVLEDSWAAYLLKDSLFGKEADFMSQLINFY